MGAKPEREWWRRGHRIVRFADGRWRWAATGRFLIMGAHASDPPCTVCHLPPTPEGHDPCLGTLPGVTSACCGHGGVVEGYRILTDGTRVVTAERISQQAPHKTWPQEEQRSLRGVMKENMKNAPER